MGAATLYQALSLRDGQACCLRPATRADRAAIIRNIDDVAAEQCFLPVKAYVPTTMWEHALDSGDDHGQTYVLIVAEMGHTVMGHLRLFPDGYAHSDRHVLDVGLALREGYRGLGIGSHMLNLASRWAAGAGYEKLTGSILANNFRALHLFLSRGYHIEGRRLKQYRLNGSFVDEILVGRAL
ncbi:MAG: GNAT family N-acetyltransferase [Caldilinea sp.]|nr:GNAT family N-acetyltransferase [Caldilineaceae bacterium]MCO5211496.1 GNAT family N-acetyltransferase [Caldilinea sp.]